MQAGISFFLSCKLDLFLKCCIYLAKTIQIYECIVLYPVVCSLYSIVSGPFRAFHVLNVFYIESYYYLSVWLLEVLSFVQYYNDSVPNFEVSFDFEKPIQSTPSLLSLVTWVNSIKMFTTFWMCSWWWLFLKVDQYYTTLWMCSWWWLFFKFEQ